MSRSTFSVLFYANKSKLKNGIVPIMGRVTINGTQSQFSCKQSIPLDLWDVKGNRAKGRSREALQLNRDLDNIKAQLIKHYQHLSDKEGFVTAEMVRNAYQGLGSEYETLLNAFNKDIASFKKRVGKDRKTSSIADEVQGMAMYDRVDADESQWADEIIDSPLDIEELYAGTLMIGSPRASDIPARVLVVKLCRPVSHLEISDSRLPIFAANSFCVIPFFFSKASMRSAISNERLNSARVSSETFARHSRNNGLVIISQKLCCLFPLSCSSQL